MDITIDTLMKLIDKGYTIDFELKYYEFMVKENGKYYYFEDNEECITWISSVWFEEYEFDEKWVVGCKDDKYGTAYEIYSTVRIDGDVMYYGLFTNDFFHHLHQHGYDEFDFESIKLDEWSKKIKITIIEYCN